MATRAEVYESIDSERTYQEAKWKGESHEVAAWLTFIRSYLNEADYQETNSFNHDALDSIRKITAMGVACLEQHGAPLRELPKPEPQVLTPQDVTNAVEESLSVTI